MFPLKYRRFNCYGLRPVETEENCHKKKNTFDFDAPFKELFLRYSFIWLLFNCTSKAFSYWLFLLKFKGFRTSPFCTERCMLQDWEEKKIRLRMPWEWNGMKVYNEIETEESLWNLNHCGERERHCVMNKNVVVLVIQRTKGTKEKKMRSVKWLDAREFSNRNE